MTTTPLTEIEKKVLEIIKPKPSEYKLLENVYEKIREHLETGFKKIGVDVEVTLQGSVAHDTWLSGDLDLDVFILFPENISIEEIRGKYFKVLVELAEKLGKVELRYAEHPYVHLVINGVKADLVPAYRVDSADKAKTAVDRTPFHTQYVNSRLTPELRDHVRLLKKFMKSIGVYGAEIKVKGFSGYAVELLVITYKGFRNVLEKASKWKPPVYVNTLEDENEFKRIIKILRKRYPDSLIYMPDPVDPLRNTTASVSRKSMALFNIASNCYLANPSPEFFATQKPSVDLSRLVEYLENRCVVLVKLPIPEPLPPDVLWGELYRIADRAVKVLANHEFYVIDYSVWSDEKEQAIIALEIDFCTKNSPRLYKGPEFWYWNRVQDFIMKHIERGSYGPWISSDGSLLALGKRKYSDVVSLLIDRSWEYVIAPHFRNTRPTVRILDKEYLESASGDLREWLEGFIIKRPFWMEKCIG
ncbi:MAG: CCA tRNA nucleotidyltransferase [Thermoprotei archaeon]